MSPSIVKYELVCMGLFAGTVAVLLSLLIEQLERAFVC